MTIKILIDMNLSPECVPWLTEAEWEAVHWSAVGNLRARDDEIMSWAVANRYVLFTHDLDFGAMLASTQAVGPSVVQLRSQRVLPNDVAPLVASALRHYEHALAAGALVVVEESRNRVRVLPL